ncbi:glycosyltransferase family A protein [Stutzerimonas kirkiae]|uniref:Glycosyltransferase family 2 protein n=1 Tax=Stutzerimonas kirkiae TaxID=2211392 RepID=A0A4Q9RGF0_9GAMM|nr:glycosyltransferase family A protein [Stutzerimonas kirkiae]TBU99965.1 glycosyltransferase family 2 protein [Stutzerimonas kirkiae]TBV05671.1 glycosyltransferase family 2 protein [Stutzerimonas kirkiae]TBV10586.1 glycosyltransferase family 2 protein [Stutzerimonas kirkiae]
MTFPLTVALLTYNRSHYLRESLSAILEQTYRDFELLVLDNGSSDDTPHVVLGFQDERIRYIRNAPGGSPGFNAISAQWIARGERLLITHDDDIMEPDMLERQMALIAARPELTAVWTNKSIIDENGTQVQPWFTPPGADRIFERGEFIARAAEESLWYPPSSLIFVPRLLASTASLRQSYLLGTPALRQRKTTKGSSDLIPPALMNLKGPVAFLNAPLLRYRQHATQETHHVHVARAALYSFQALQRLVRKTSFREEYEPVFAAQIARFEAQDLVIDIDQPAFDRPMLKRLAGLLGKGAAGIAANPRAGQPLLPLIVLLIQGGARGAEEACKVLDGIEAPNAQAPRSIRSLYRWAGLRRDGGNLFAGLAPQARVVILGSVLVSALLVNEARAAGATVVCCLDSNVTRQGRTWLGVPIVAPSWLASCDEPVDLIVLSSERDHEQELEELIRRHDATTPIASWKGLVEAAKPSAIPLHGESAE